MKTSDRDEKRKRWVKEGENEGRRRVKRGKKNYSEARRKWKKEEGKDGGGGRAKGWSGE